MGLLGWFKKKNDEQIADRAEKKGISVEEERKDEGYDQALGGHVEHRDDGRLTPPPRA